LPVVESAAMASVPFGGGKPRPFSVADHPALDGSNPLRAAVVAIGSRYFETLGVSVRRGRVFKASDGEAGQEHVIVNDSFADRFLAGVDPIGRRVQLSIATSTTPSEWLTIVGVSPTVGRLPQPTIYVPLKWEPVQAVSLVVRSTAAGAALAAMLRDEVRALDDDLPLFRVETLEESLAFARWPERVFGSIFGIFAALGLALSAVGLYAVVRYLVAQRTHEVGVRMALGARAAQVTWLMVRRTIIHLAIGFGIGLPIAVGIGLGLPFGSRDLATLVPVMALLLAVTLAACAVPARRAARLDPISALRHE